MLIVCPACATEYTLEADRVGAKGRIVRCARCKTSWFASAPPEASLNKTSLGTTSLAKTALSRTAPGRTGAASASRSPTVIEEADTVPAARRRPGRMPAKKPRARKRFRVSSGHAVVTVFVTAVIVLSAISFRVPLVRAAPSSAKLFAAVGLPVNALGLTLADVSSNFDEEFGRRILVTEGTITNASRRELAVPDLELTVLGAEGETLYQWSAKPPSGELASEETKRFSIRLASPPPAGTQVLVTFLPHQGGGAVASR